PGDVVEHPLVPRDPRQVQRIAEEIAARDVMAADAHIVEHRHAGEQREVLERAADADLDHAVGRLVEDADALKQDITLDRRVEAGGAGEKTGFFAAAWARSAEPTASPGGRGRAPHTHTPP